MQAAVSNGNIVLNTVIKKIYEKSYFAYVQGESSNKYFTMHYSLWKICVHSERRLISLGTDV